MDPILDTAPCGFVSFTDDGTIQTINQTLLNLIGRSRTGVEGQHVETLLSPGAQVFYHTHLFPLLKMQGRIDEVYVSLRDAEDEDINCLLNAKRTEREGHPVNDVTLVPFEERNQYEDEILQAKQAAEEASRAKDKLLSTISHELKTPISTIKSLSQYLSMGVRGPVTDEQQDYLNRIERSVDYLSTLINDILDFARLETGPIDVNTEPVRLEDALTRAEALVQVRFEEAGLTYDRQLSPADVSVMADPDRLQQVLLNLLTNAIKFTPPKGSVSVRSEKEDDVVRIHVRDTGVGIPEEAQSYIFDPFVQATDTIADDSGGVGLGLAISRDLVEAMDGRLTVESKEDEGTVFTITLPYTSADLPASPPPRPRRRSERPQPAVPDPPLGGPVATVLKGHVAESPDADRTDGIEQRTRRRKTGGFTPFRHCATTPAGQHRDLLRAAPVLQYETAK